MPFNKKTAKEAGKKGGLASKRDKWKEEIQDFLNTRISKDKTRKDRLLEVAFEQAEKGNIKAMEFLADRGFGKPQTHIEHSGETEKRPVKFVFSNGN